MQTWKEAKESFLFKSADLVSIVDLNGEEMWEVPMEDIPDSVPVTIVREAEAGHVEVVLDIIGDFLKEEVKEAEMMKKVILGMWERQKAVGIEVFDYEDSIMPNKIPATVAALKSLHIERFTISNRQSGMPDLLARFGELGYELKGLVKIPNRQFMMGEDYSSSCEKQKNAFLIVAK